MHNAYAALNNNTYIIYISILFHFLTQIRVNKLTSLSLFIEDLLPGLFSLEFCNDKVYSSLFS